MSWRTVIISQRSKLDLRMGCMVVRSEKTTHILISEIGVLIVDNTGCSFTSALLAELVKNKVKVIFSDEKHNPICETTPYVGSHNCTKTIRTQINWQEDWCQKIWTEIVIWKIKKQRDHLLSHGLPQADLLSEYLKNVELGDVTNREGHAAKVYFNALWGKDFSRERDCPINAALNYGYALLLSLFNKEIVAAGYLTQLGIWHDNQFNPYNLTSDLMEPYRPLVDRLAYRIQPRQFAAEEKQKMVSLLETKLLIEGQEQFLPAAVRIYVKSALNRIEQKPEAMLAMYSDIHV